jgi:4-hydroxy-2-oxoheptanedioate aldolase
MRNLIKEKLDRGEAPVGTFSWTNSPVTVECLAHAGLDYVILDCEHTPADAETVVSLIRAAEAKGITPFVRARELSRSAILKLLDGGAMGVVIPNLKTVAQVRRVAEYGKYPPVGQRGFIQSREADYGAADFAAAIPSYMAVSNRETLLLPQCETAELLSCIEEAVAVPGIDGVLVGPYDLSLSLGIPGQFDHLDFLTALRRIAAACRAAGKYAFIFAPDDTAARRYLAMGFHSAAISTDVHVLLAGFRAVADALGE